MLKCNNQGNHYIEVTNDALMVLRFSIIYKEKRQQTDNILIFGTRRLYFPEGASQATLLVEGLYPPGFWVEMLKDDYYTDKDYCFSVYGIFFLPSIRPRPCTTSSNICSEKDLQMRKEVSINCMYESYLKSITQCKL